MIHYYLVWLLFVRPVEIPHLKLLNHVHLKVKAHELEVLDFDLVAELAVLLLGIMAQLVQKYHRQHLDDELRRDD